VSALGFAKRCLHVDQAGQRHVLRNQVIADERVCPRLAAMVPAMLGGPAAFNSSHWIWYLCQYNLKLQVMSVWVAIVAPAAPHASRAASANWGLWLCDLE
jgi:hypothetical protein